MRKQQESILLVANWESNVGYAWWLMENFWVTISKFAERNNLKTILVYPKITEIPSSIASSKISVIEYPVSKTITGLLELKNIINQHNIKYVYLTDYPSYSLYYLILKLFGIQKIIIHDHKPGERPVAKGIIKLIKSILHRSPLISADHYIAVTDFIRNRFILTACIPENKCSVAPNGIIPIDLTQTDADYAHKIFNIPKDRFIVVTTGRASYYKGIDFFIECANEIINKQGITSLHFLYCGDGPDIDDFKNMVKTYSLNKHFTFSGKRDDVRKILPACHIGFHSSHGEVGYSLSILEYMSAALLTIVSDNPSVSMAIKHNSTGMIYKQNNLANAVSCILMYLEDKEKCLEIARKASKFVNSEMSLDLTNQALDAIIDKVIIQS